MSFRKYTEENFSSFEYGRDVLGPIFAEFSLRLYIYLLNIEDKEATSLLFCARGGLRLQLLFEKFLSKTYLFSPLHFSSLMVSRVIAVRPALLAGAPSAFEQIGREFAGDSLGSLLQAVTGIERQSLNGLDDIWSRPYSADALKDILEGRHPEFISNLSNQVNLFRSHLRSQSEGKTRIILCDTGLFGSTLQFLRDGMTDIDWSCCLFARNNYKGFETPHFSKTIGLSVEATCYSPLNPRTAVLRFWHLIESVLEPDLPSATVFFDRDGHITSNLQIADWQSRVEARPDTTFAGVVNYFDCLPDGTKPLEILASAQISWRALKRSIIWPTAEMAAKLNPGTRSRDFGRTEGVSFFNRPINVRNIFRRSLWREGEISQLDVVLRPVLLLCVELAYSARWILKEAKRILHRL